jgi:hypothetical protein
MRRKYNIGDVWPTKCGVGVRIISKDTPNQKLTVKWLDEYGYEYEVYQCAVFRQELKNPYEKTVAGVGYIGLGDHRSNPLKYKAEYVVWAGILDRGYGDKVRLNRPGYDETIVEDVWHNFGGFIDWTRSAIGWGKEGWHVDKDLLVRGNKSYGPDVCCMLPGKINSNLWIQTKEGDTLPGVIKIGNSYRANTKLGEVTQARHFKTEQDAFSFYRQTKEAYIKYLAEQYRDELDPRAYQALMSWEILP